MEYNYLGSSGFRVSNICLGSRTFGETESGSPCCPEDQCHTLLDTFKANGGNFIDTAGAYEYGKPECIIGDWLHKQERCKIVIATKIRYSSRKDGGYPNGAGLSRSQIHTAVSESLARLRTDYIDLLQIHGWDPATSLEETFSTLHDLVSCGKVRYLGASNLTGWQLQKIQDLCRHRGWTPLVTVQHQWNLLERHVEWEVNEVCRNEGVGVLAWGPLRGGWLSGKFSRDMTSLPSSSRIGWVSKSPDERTTFSHVPFETLNQDRVWSITEALKNVAQETGRTCSQVSIRWLLQNEAVSSVLVGVTSLEQLTDNLGANGWALTQEQMDDLDAASRLELPYPYNMNQHSMATRTRDNCCR